MLQFRHFVEQMSGELSAKDGILVGHKRLGAALHQGADHTRAQIGNLLVGVGDHAHNLLAARPSLRFEEGQEELLHFRCGEDFQFMCILDVHHFVADIVGRLHKVDQRVACIAEPVGTVVLKAYHAQLRGDAPETVAFGG